MNRKFAGRAILLILLSIFGGHSASAQTAPPRVFFTDLSSGPNSGGESVSGFSGAYVNVYGNNFGPSQGNSTITWNGQSCLRVVSWGTSWLWYQKIVVQLGSSCTVGAGTFTVTVNGAASTSVSENTSSGTQVPSQFAVVSTGHIYCVSTSGKDSNSGTFSGGCWATVPHAGHTMAAGDITYVQNGVVASAVDNYNAAFAVGSAGTAGAPIALVAYPGATATIGTTTLSFGVRTPAVSGGPFSYWTLAGFTLLGADSLEIGQGTATNWRVVGNTAQCPNGQGQDACMQGAQGAGNLAYYGNFVSDSGLNCPASNCKEYHAMYMTTDTNHVWMGWNEVNPDPANTGVAGCRAIQFNSTPEGAGTGLDQYDLHVHDNFILNAICDGVNFNTVNPDAGTVEAYNNVIWHVGKGPNPPIDQESNYTCINLNSSAAHTKPVQVYNNTLYDCGAVPDSDASSDKGMFSLTIPLQLNNNIIFQSNSGVPYITNNTAGNSSKITGSNNIWYGAGAKPSAIATMNDLSNVNPLLNAPGSGNFTLQAASPAIGAGTSSKYSSYDYSGLIRPVPPSIGALELTSGSSVQRPNPPTGLVVVVK